MILPILLVLAYSYVELSSVGDYVATHQEEIAAKVNEAVRSLPFLGELQRLGDCRPAG